jgi:hypothetical protein
MIETKRCIGCGVERSLLEFYVMRSSKDGRQSRCKACDNSTRMGNYARGSGKCRNVIRREDGSLVFVARPAAKE